MTDSINSWKAGIVPTDLKGRVARLESSFGKKRTGTNVYSSGKNKIPATATVTANGQIATSGISASGSTTSYIVSGQLGFTATSNSITIYWDGSNNSSVLTIQRSDGTSTSIPSGSQTVTGLSGGSYGFSCYWNITQGTSGALAFGSGSAGTPKIAVPSTADNATIAAALQQQQATSAEAIYAGMIYFSTGSSSAIGKNSAGVVYSNVRVRGFSG